MSGDILSRMSYSRYDSLEDHLIKLTLKISLLLFVLAIEVIIILVIIRALWGTSF